MCLLFVYKAFHIKKENALYVAMVSNMLAGQGLDWCARDYDRAQNGLVA